jgi:hypothetical protein
LVDCWITVRWLHYLLLIHFYLFTHKPDDVLNKRFFWALRRHLEGIVELLINCLSWNSTSSVDELSAHSDSGINFSWEKTTSSLSNLLSVNKQREQIIVRRLLQQKKRFVSFRKTFLIWKVITVKRGYNEVGYNKLPLIANKTFLLFGSGCFTLFLCKTNRTPVITNKLQKTLENKKIIKKF